MEDLDKIDAEAIAATLRSPGWKLIAARIDSEGGKRVKDLVEVSHSEAEMFKIRGEIVGLRLALNIPGYLAKEAQVEAAPRRPKK